MARKSAEPPRNRRTTPPENKRSLRPTERVPLRARWAVFRERMRVRIAHYKTAGIYVGRGVVLVAGLAGMLAVGKLIERHVSSSPSFATREIEVRGASHLSHAEVVRAAGLAMGQNVFAVGPAQAKANLLAEPWVESAEVRRRLPDRFEVEIRERRALALLALDQLYVVAEDGSAFKVLGPGDPADLPVITGLDPEAVQRDKQGSAEALVGAVGLLHDYEDAGLHRQKSVSEIHVETDGSLSLYVGGEPTYVRLGRAPFRTKLGRLREVFSQLGREKASAAYVYLDSDKRPDRVTVRLR